MKKNLLHKSLLGVLLTASLLLTACQGKSAEVVAEETENVTEATAENTKQAEEIKADEVEESTEEPSASESKVATADEMADPVDILDESMVPVTGEDLKDGVYSVIVDSSSSMFQITDCELTVENGEMTAVMTMGGTGYLYLYMGTGEEAVEASEDAYIPFVETAEGVHTFRVPVPALDAAVDCSAFSKKKEKWYDRILVFRADSLPLEAFAEGYMTTVESLELEDGLYTVDVTLEGGSGKASVDSPTSLEIKDGKAFATLVWSSKNYDYMLVGEERYDNQTPGENSTFVIPVAGFDCKLKVVGDTTAMSTPHEIDYTLFFTADSITKAE